MLIRQVASLEQRCNELEAKRDDGEPIESKGELPKLGGEDSSTYAFVLKKIIYNTTSIRQNRSEINITSLALWNLLRKHLRWYPYHMFGETPVTLHSPYKYIVYFWDQLRKEASEHEPNESDSERLAKSDLRDLLKTISGGSSGDEKLDMLFKTKGDYSNYKSQEQETVQFHNLWTIFPPGTLIYGKPFQNEDQVFVVTDTNNWPGSKKDSGEYHPWCLLAWSYDWKDDHSSFGRCYYTLLFEPFDGHRPIKTLPFYPFEMHTDHKRVKSDLTERGKLFQQYCNTTDEARMFSYQGNAIPEKKGFSGMKSEDVDGRVMVDYFSFYQYGPDDGRNGALRRNMGYHDCECSDCQSNEGLAQRYRARFDRVPRDQDWEDEQYLLCPPRVLGYVLAEKQWAQLQVTNLKAIPHGYDQEAWKSRLKLADEETKDLLFDLVRCHVSSEAQSINNKKLLAVDDIVPGKGKGLVILLYGPPGVGKSSTAETIAVATRKPLFSISVADVGTEARHVESNLSKIFSLATHWKAILLIDEADVFLESRGRGGIVQSMDKNALVSVFLRVLEYYKGIMFLTTNQIAEFDVAIPSRIHIAIKYESLRTDQMEAIFRGFLDNLNQRGMVDDYNEIMSWLKEDVYPEGLDGRQIRNTITAALNLANADAKYHEGKSKVGKSHIKKAFNNAKKFKRDFDTQMQRYKDSQNKMIQ
ncbi:P-loop containing nucleoside triphosphate hydrolase protein [Nemania sp. FL0916]|nr:P-loop containing nucleoside triphosphate hydrolase protein [Nemania sp. FL0916]